METSTRPPAKRGRPSKFNSTDAVTVALDIGVAKFTMREVATHLKVSTPALYRCFSSRESLLNACLAEISSRLDIPTNDGQWQTYLHNIADQSWTLFTRYPGLDSVIHSHNGRKRTPFPIRESDFDCLQNHGFSRNQATFALSYILDLTTSAVSTLQNQLDEISCFSGSAGTAAFWTGDGEPIHDGAHLSEYSRQQWRSNIDFFVDHLVEKAPHWPSWIGPLSAGATRDLGAGTPTDNLSWSP